MMMQHFGQGVGHGEIDAEMDHVASDNDGTEEQTEGLEWAQEELEDIDVDLDVEEGPDSESEEDLEDDSEPGHLDDDNSDDDDVRDDTSTSDSDSDSECGGYASF
jgi:hypothetical protein